jgi:disulfide bond formation protein DsbB
MTKLDMGWWTAAAMTAASVAILGAALVAEHGFGLMPCELCFAQRPSYALAILFGALSLMPAVDGRSRRVVVLHVAGLFAITAGIGAYHAGVEWQWWQGPTACTGTAVKIDFDNLMAALNKPGAVACDQAAVRFLGLSMAGYNFLAATGLAIAVSWAGMRKAWWSAP